MPREHNNVYFISPMPPLFKAIQSCSSRPAAFAAFCFLFTLLLAYCSEPLPHEQQIENNIHQLADTIEQLDADELKKHLDANIDIDNKGNQLDMEQVKKIMMLYRFKKQEININIAKIDISMDKYSSHLAKANITALVTGSRGLLPNDGKLYQIESQWRLYDEQWKLSQASWK